MNEPSGPITTLGTNSIAIFAQSVGGGGGSTSVAYGQESKVDISAAVTVGGDGGTVDVANESAINGRGENSFAILAQSVGGAGGLSAMPAGSLNATLGGGTDAAGTSGDIMVSNSGKLVIEGGHSFGILAQSVGGSGDFLMGGNGSGTFSLVQGGRGDAGTVTVSNTGDVSVLGRNSVALYAQSVAGGGGAASGLSGLPTPNSLMLGGTPGGSGAVSGHSGLPTPNSLMQSGTAGGSGFASDVTVDQTGNLLAMGENSIAILAQSSARDGTGDITVNVLSADSDAPSFIVGGSGGGVGVVMLESRDNVLDNSGVVTSTPGVDGFAVVATIGNDTIDNRLLMIGSVDLGAGANGFNNHVAAAYISGPTVVLGDGNLLTNQGLILPGDWLRMMTSNITGGFVQTASGTYHVDLDLSDQVADRINATNSARVSGTVVANILNPGLALPGSHGAVIVHADQGVTDHTGLTLLTVPSTVATYSLSYPNANDIVLSYSINFAPQGMTENQLSVGDAVNRIQLGRTSPAFAKIAAALFYHPNMESLGATYDTLSGEAASAAQQVAFLASDTFMRIISQQAGDWRDGSDSNRQSYVLGGNGGRAPAAYMALGNKAGDTLSAVRPMEYYLPRTWRMWAALHGADGHLKGDAIVQGSARSNFSSSSFAAGMDYQVTPELLFGLAGGVGRSSYNLSGRAPDSGSTDDYHVAVYGTGKWNEFYASGVVGMGFFSNDMNRNAMVPGSTAPMVHVPGFAEFLNGKFDSRSLDGRFELGWRKEFGQIAITPFGGIQFSALHTDAFSETQRSGIPSVLGLRQQSRDTVSLPGFLGAQIDVKSKLSDELTLSAWTRVSWLHEFRNRRSIASEFLSAPGYDFIIHGAPAARDTAQVAAGVKFDFSNQLSLFASFNGDFSDKGRNLSGSGGLRVSW